MKKHHVSTTINGEPTEFLCEPQLTLLDVLRDELHLTGSKEGCSTGDCGACSVTVDGRLVCSCLMLGVEAEGHGIETVEGMAHGDDLHPLQRKFLEHAALQCGICTPGVLVAAKALLDRNPDPTEDETRYWLAGNLCRCTGYDKIIRAVLDAAAEMRAKPIGRGDRDGVKLAVSSADGRRPNARRALLERRVFCLHSGSLRIGQRVWKWQPEGGRIGFGTSPCSTMRWRLALGSGIGTAESSASV